jgi:hypothetical protein
LNSLFVVVVVVTVINVILEINFLRNKIFYLFCFWLKMALNNILSFPSFQFISNRKEGLH